MSNWDTFVWNGLVWVQGQGCHNQATATEVAKRWALENGCDAYRIRDNSNGNLFTTHFTKAA